MCRRTRRPSSGGMHGMLTHPLPVSSEGWTRTDRHATLAQIYAGLQTDPERIWLKWTGGGLPPARRQWLSGVTSSSSAGNLRISSWGVGAT